MYCYWRIVRSYILHSKWSSIAKSGLWHLWHVMKVFFFFLILWHHFLFLVHILYVFWFCAQFLAAAAAKLLQCLTLCNPIDGSLPGSFSLGFSRREYWSGLPYPSQSLSCGQLSATLWTVVHQVPLSMEFPRQEYWSGVPFPTPGDLPDPGTETHVSCIGRWVPYHCTTSILIKAEIFLSELWIWIIACSLYLLIRHYPEKSGVGLIEHCFSQNSSSSDSC